ncbi:hypothetical protein AVEN_154015-1 [Araneus ventricosus]|uniref:Uncharacterized protein n=1 Tax=Araneus ventricosus TaxID=182803 RepID=A0A4Y2QL65_ARAVE|nr:hypothetical protein AVEN_17010-1 [Araneus ventricosus]GBN62457.1 hypothetical protein AVEN_108641-1 [Araneus ventricosus]GBN64006.1 hypothetical protein AVEN_24921-1 [Araneus ventricosus]GBN64095.1 hypothetical protein AVEN_154015-1 [Araneus ventricosus]
MKWTERRSYGRIFDHPLFDWSNYDGSKSLKTGVEFQNMDLGGKGYFVYVFERRSSSLLLCYTFWGAQSVFCLRGPLAIGQAGNLASPPLGVNSPTRRIMENEDSFTNMQGNT